MVRFAPAAVVALAATQVTYFLAGSVWHLTGRVTGAAGWLAGAVVSYGVSRWAWERRGRPRLLAETVPFVAISAVSGAVLIEASHLGYQQAAALGLRGVAFHAYAQGFFLTANCVTFILRFVVFNFVVFADRKGDFAGLYSRFRRLAPQFARFGVVGACGLLVSGAVASLLHGEAGVKPLTSGLIAAVAATAISFAGNRYWTFRHHERTTVGREGIRYLALTGAGLVIQLACLRFTAGVLGLQGKLPGLGALALGIGLGIVFRFWSCRTWVWRAPRAASTATA